MVLKPCSLASNNLSIKKFSSDFNLAHVNFLAKINELKFYSLTEIRVSLLVSRSDFQSNILINYASFVNRYAESKII